MRRTTSRSAESRPSGGFQRSASGSMCVWTSSTQAQLERLPPRPDLRPRGPAPASAPREASDAATPQFGRRRRDATLCTSRTPELRGRRHARGREWRPLVFLQLDVSSHSLPGSASLRASRPSAAAWPWPTAAPGAPPITTSMNCRGPAWRMRSRRRATGGSIPRDRRAGSFPASAGARSISVDVPLHQADGREQTRTATKSAAAESARGWPGEREQADQPRPSPRVAGEVECIRGQRRAVVAA